MPAYKLGKKPAEHMFLFNMRSSSHPINPFPVEVIARDLGHALQKIAAQLSNECVEVKVWKRKRFDDRSKT